MKKAGIRIAAVLATVVGVILAMAAPAYADQQGWLRTVHYYDVENMYINRDGGEFGGAFGTDGCEAFIELDGRSRGVHPTPVAISFDKLVLMKDGIQVAVLGYTHQDGNRLHVGTTESSGWYATEGIHTWQAKVAGIRVRYADGYLSGNQSAHSDFWRGRCEDTTG